MSRLTIKRLEAILSISTSGLLRLKRDASTREIGVKRFNQYGVIVELIQYYLVEAGGFNQEEVTSFEF